jgi:hypothetical protein
LWSYLVNSVELRGMIRKIWPEQWEIFTENVTERKQRGTTATSSLSILEQFRQRTIVASKSSDTAKKVYSPA